ncbi:fimbrial biogenesis chaperone [Dyella flagellata]|uniref:fimbrial biogenesis chaperone n=1 Tax=Dyella flagellata TaxID=1867833 RepID=UPI00384A93DF
MSTAASAGIVITGTRVIYPGHEREVSIKLTNQGRAPALVQAWLDGGDASSTPSTGSAPFLITPPIFRMNSGKGQTLRLAYTGEPLPRDRESVFWLNVYEMPPVPSGTSENYLQFAMRTRIKVFFRPKLEGHSNDAPAKLQWHVVKSPSGSGYAVECENPTPYHVSFRSVALHAAGLSYAAEQGGMVAPFAKAVFPLAGLDQSPSTGAKLAAEVINDYGGIQTLKVDVAPARS